MGRSIKTLTPHSGLVFAQEGKNTVTNLGNKKASEGGCATVRLMASCRGPESVVSPPGLQING